MSKVSICLAYVSKVSICLGYMSKVSKSLTSDSSSAMERASPSPRINSI